MDLQPRARSRFKFFVFCSHFCLHFQSQSSLQWNAVSTICGCHKSFFTYIFHPFSEQRRAAAHFLTEMKEMKDARTAPNRPIPSAMPTPLDFQGCPFLPFSVPWLKSCFFLKKLYEELQKLHVGAWETMSRTFQLFGQRLRHYCFIAIALISIDCSRGKISSALWILTRFD